MDDFDDNAGDADAQKANNQEALDSLPELRRVEAVLFLAKDPVNSRKLSQLAGLTDGTQARTLIRQLNQNLDHCGRAFKVQVVAGGFQLRTRPAFDSWLSRLAQTPRAIRWSVPAMETLAVVAYRQPVLKADIEAIRGVGCGELLRQLLDRGMVRIAGRSNDLGNPYLYGTTKRFQEVFGLSSLDALPRGKKLRGSGIPPVPVPAKYLPETPVDPLDEMPSNPQNLEPVNEQ